VTRTTPSIGDLLREWRRRRRLTQLQLADRANISARHLCFLETGRASPSRDMLLRLAEHLQVPLRERNALLKAAGFSAIFTEQPLTGTGFDVVRQAINAVLAGHEPYPAFAVDRHWTLELDEAVIGFASYGDWRARWGYRYTVEHSVHVEAQHRGHGTGRALVEALLIRARSAGMHIMIGGIDAANLGSIRFHQRLGFVEAGRYREVAHKFGRWLDLVSMQYFLDDPGSQRC
jgi:L-amino acid N-acyltransferase YncA/DNA-binding XRE family transcriptional regulator